MIINKPKDRRATILGQPFLAPVAAPPPKQRDTKIDAFNGIANLSHLCQRKERDIKQLEDATARGAVEDPDGATEHLIRGFAKDAQDLIDKTADGDGRALVVRAARRKGMALLEEAAAARDRGGQRFIATRIKDVTDSLTAQVATNPLRLKGAREMLGDLIAAADLAPEEQDTIARAANVQLTTAAQGQPKESTQQVAGSVAEQALPVVLASDIEPQSFQPASNAEEGQRTDLPLPGQRDEKRNRETSEVSNQAHRNEILEQNGFRFVDTPHEGFWVDPDNERASPNALRELIVDQIETRAKSEGWNSARILAELHRAKEGLPWDEERNVETAFVFAPFLPFLFAAGEATVTAGGVLKAILGGVGLATILGLSGDTPLREIEQVDDNLLLQDTADTDDEPERNPTPPPPLVPKPDVESDDGDRELIRVYRVETARGKFQRIIVHPDGFVTIRLKRHRMLHLNFGQRKRAIEFLEKKIFGGEVVEPVIKSFLVPKELLDKIRAAAIEQDNAKTTDPLRQFPRKVDPKQADDQFELPRWWILEVQRQIVQPTGRVERPEEVLP